MKAKYIIKGIGKNIPGIRYVYQFNKKTGGSCNARYCYSVWLRHLISAYHNGLNSIPKVIVELGPGDSLGTGLAALISGAEKYYALDVKKYRDVSENLQIFDDLVTLFKEKTEIPGGHEFPKIKPVLENYSFPKNIFSEKYLNKILDESRLASIRQAISDIDSTGIPNKDKMIEYIVPWHGIAAIKDSTVDMVFSQAALQCIDRLDHTYKNIWQWLKPNGIQSHEIEFKSCGSAATWYGHWEYSDFEWKIVKGRKNFYINREPYSTHYDLLQKNNFKIILEKKDIIKSNINRKKLALRFRNMSDTDLSTRNAFVIAKKISS